MLIAPGAHDRPVVFPGWTLPGVITAGGAQTLVKTQRVLPGQPHRLRRQRPARARVPGAAARLRRERRRRARGGTRARRRATSLAARSPPRAATATLLRDAVAYRDGAAARTACRCATGGSSCAPRATAGSSRSSTPPPTATGGRSPAARSASRPTRSASATASSPRSSCCGSPAATSRYDEDLGGPVVGRRRVAAHDARRGSRRPATGPASPGSYVAIDRGAAGGARRRARPRRARRGGRRRPRGADRAPAAPEAALPPRRCAGCTASAPGIYELATPETVVCRCEEVARRASSTTAIEATDDRQRRQGAHAGGHGPLPGPQLPAPGRRDDRAAPRRPRSPSCRSRRRARRCGRCRSARSPTRSLEDEGFFR